MADLDQQSLFDFSEVPTKLCPFCAVDDPEKCTWKRDLDRTEYVTRPKGCIASYDPSTSEIPF